MAKCTQEEEEGGGGGYRNNPMGNPILLNKRNVLFHRSALRLA